MNLYIDKENLLSLVRQIKSYSDRDTVDDCLRMIRKQLHLVYNFKKEDIGEQLYQLWFNTLVQGRGYKDETDTSCSPPFPNRPLMDSSFRDSDWETISSTYLCSDIGAESIRARNSILLSGKDLEIPTLSKLFWGDYSYTKEYDLSNGALSFGWKELEEDGHCLPCTDILLVDRYLLSDTRNFRNNLFPLLRRLTSHVSAPVNLTVFVERTENFYTKQPYNSSDYEAFVKQLSDVRKGHSFPLNVTIVVYPENMLGGFAVQKTIPHGRFLLTNYRLFISDPSFGSYFNKDRNLSTNGMYLTVHSLANNETYRLAKGWIDHFQCILDKIYQLHRPSDYIFGTRRSSLFHFN